MQEIVQLTVGTTYVGILGSDGIDKRKGSTLRA